VTSDSNLNSGRINQKHRTRNALMEAAAALMRQGHIPSIEEVADAAQVSRATAYRYFPTQEHLIAGSAVLNANLDGDAKLEAGMNSDDPSTRLDHVVQTFHERFSSNELAYRTLLSLMLHRAASDTETAEEEQPRVRASRHVYWLQKALTPIQPRMDTARFERLLAALAAATGFEAYTALRDISLLDPDEAKEIMRWTAQTLLKESLADIDQ
jgi:AcrR family transcriptional regulator